jgi:hypothetical protein
MNKAMLTVGIILLSIVSLVLINVLTNYSTGSELDYYLVKETADAAMVDALDQSYVRTCGVYRIDREKFVESFLYRFADSVDTTRSYKVSFYDINEVPPKASVKVDSLTVLSFSGDAVDLSTSYDSIIESKLSSDAAVEEGLNNNSDLCKSLSNLS